MKHFFSEIKINPFFMLWLGERGYGGGVDPLLLFLMISLLGSIDELGIEQESEVCFW